MVTPQTRYARRPDGVSVGYQVLGEGPETLVFCWGWMSHLDLQWSDPALARTFERIAGFCRLVVFDRAGVGVSDPLDHIPTLEERVAEVGAVMDAVGIERATIFGESEAGPVAALFAATHPERTDALALYGSIATGQPDDAELAPYGGRARETDELRARLEHCLDHFGEGLCADWMAPSVVSPAVRRNVGTFERSAVSPAMARGLIDHLLAIDVRPVLAAIQAPTMVLHRVGDVVPVAHARLLADRIPGARLVELEGRDHAFWTEGADILLGEVEALVTGRRAAASRGRALMTVLFTDIVDSTRRAAEAGDAAWRRLLEGHDASARRVVAETEGRVVKLLGDGMLAVFTGPTQAIACARSLIDDLGALGLEVRAGVHTGECELIGDDLGGMAVHIGARVSALAGPGEIAVSKTVVDLVVGSGLGFSERGEHDLKGVPGRWRVFVVDPAEGSRDAAGPPGELMTRGDRLRVGFVRRAPAVARAMSRLTVPGYARDP